MASQKSGSGFGILIGLILSIFIIIGLIYTTVTNNTAYWAEVEKVRNAQADVEDARKKETEAKREVQAAYEIVHGSTAPVDLEKVKRDYLKAAGAKLDEVLGQEQISSEQFAKDLNKDGKLQTKEYKYLLEMYADLFIELGAAIPELNRLRLEKTTALAELETTRASARKERAEVDSQLEKERKEKSELNAKLLEDAKNFDQEKRRLGEEITTVRNEIAKKEEERLIAEAKLESKIRELEHVIAENAAKKARSLAETEADGEIVHSDQRLGRAWINIGQKQRVRRGTIFDVFQYVKGGVKKSKGKVEVKRLEDDMAEVAILSQADVSDPLVKGDFVATPIYDRKKTQVFVFVGAKLSPRARYPMDELIRRIEETGGKVDKDVTIETDFVVAIEDAEQHEDFGKAVQFGIVIMREAELLEYLGR